MQDLYSYYSTEVFNLCKKSFDIKRCCRFSQHIDKRNMQTEVIIIKKKACLFTLALILCIYTASIGYKK